MLLLFIMHFKTEAAFRSFLLLNSYALLKEAKVFANEKKLKMLNG